MMRGWGDEAMRQWNGYCIFYHQMTTDNKDNKDINKWAQVFSAMSQETRLQLLMALASRERAGMTPTALATMLAIPANTLSFHLRALELSGLVRVTKQGREKTYCIEFHLVEEAIKFLMKEFFGATDIRFRVARDLSKTTSKT